MWAAIIPIIPSSCASRRNECSSRSILSRWKSVAFRDFPDAYIEDWIESLQRVEVMDFDILAPGHGPLGRKEHVRMFREYMQDLHGAVLQYAREGKSLEEMKTLIKLPKYEKWASYQQWFPLNIEGMYRHVQLHRLQNP